MSTESDTEKQAWIDRLRGDRQGRPAFDRAALAAWQLAPTWETELKYLGQTFRVRRARNKQDGKRQLDIWLGDAFVFATCVDIPELNVEKQKPPGTDNPAVSSSAAPVSLPGWAAPGSEPPRLTEWGANPGQPWDKPRAAAPAETPRSVGRPPKPFETPTPDKTVIFPGAPYDVARKYVSLKHPGGKLRHHRGDFFVYDGAAYLDTDTETIRAWLYGWLATCWQYNDKKELIPVLPSSRLVGAVLDALAAAVQVDNKLEPPCWLSASEFSAKHLICCRNGVLHYPSGRLLSPTPELFTANAVDFGYDPNAPQPVHWFGFLDSVWPGDSGSIECLQELFGYFLTDDTSQQKIALLKGPRRSGKSLIGRILTELVGKRNTCAPTLSSLGSEFGLQPLIRKQVAIVGDARLGGRSDVAAITERLLSISGEDMLNINRKNSSFWIGTLRTRFLIITNELPRLADTSSALPGRLVILVLTKSFYGREDRGLPDRIMPELPGILNWSLEGLRRLRQRGHFLTPKSSDEAVSLMDQLSSPMKAFLEAAYQPGGQVLVDDFCRDFKVWSVANGREFSGSNIIIGSMLHDVVSNIKTTQLRTGDLEANGNRSRQRWFVGLQPRQS